MKQYWIIIDEQPSGPYTYEQLAELDTFTPDTPVWYESLTDWIKASDVADLAPLFVSAAVTGEPVPGMPPIIDETVNEVACTQASHVVEPAVEAEIPARPANYLAWSIVSIILFFTIAGIVALIYSIRVNVNYKHQRYAKSVRCSDRAQWWIIASIVVACIMMPFQILFI